MKPIILNRAQLRAVLTTGQVEIRRPVPGPIALRRRDRPGDRLRVRSFSARSDGDRLEIRCPIDRDRSQPRFVPGDEMRAMYRTRRYVTRPAIYMPRWASRLTLEILTVTEQGAGPDHVVVLHTRPIESSNQPGRIVPSGDAGLQAERPTG